MRTRPIVVLLGVLVLAIVAARGEATIIWSGVALKCKRG